MHFWPNHGCGAIQAAAGHPRGIPGLVAGHRCHASRGFPNRAVGESHVWVGHVVNDVIFTKIMSGDRHSMSHSRPSKKNTFLPSGSKYKIKKHNWISEINTWIVIIYDLETEGYKTLHQKKEVVLFGLFRPVCERGGFQECRFCVRFGDNLDWVFPLDYWGKD